MSQTLLLQISTGDQFDLTKVRAVPTWLRIVMSLAIANRRYVLTSLLLTSTCDYIHTAQPSLVRSCGSVFSSVAQTNNGVLN